MTSKTVFSDQLDIIDGWLVHQPTQAKFKLAYPESSSKDTSVNWGFAGDILADGTYYERDDIARMAGFLLAQKQDEF
jgi:hypothetical protein